MTLDDEPAGRARDGGRCRLGGLPEVAFAAVFLERHGHKSDARAPSDARFHRPGDPYFKAMASKLLHPHDLLDLTGRVAIVTGASQGIGAAIAERFGTAGARVIVHYRRDRQGGNHVVRAITRAGGTAGAIHADLDTEGGVAAFFAEADDRLGPVDILVNNAGQNFPLNPIARISLEEW